MYFLFYIIFITFRFKIINQSLDAQQIPSTIGIIRREYSLMYFTHFATWKPFDAKFYWETLNIINLAKKKKLNINLCIYAV